MGREIERKYLVTDDAWRAEAVDISRILILDVVLVVGAGHR